MDNKRPLLSGEFGQDEDPFSAAPPPTRVTTGSSNTAALPPPPRDAAWAVAFKANLAFTLLSVRSKIMLEGWSLFLAIFSPTDCAT